MMIVKCRAAFEKFAGFLARSKGGSSINNGSVLKNFQTKQTSETSFPVSSGCVKQHCRHGALLTEHERPQPKRKWLAGRWNVEQQRERNLTENES